MRYAVCPQSPGNLWWQGYGVEHLKGVSNPVKRFATSKGARNYAKKKAMDYEYGLVVVDSEKGLVDWGDGSNTWSKPEPEDA